MLRIVDIIHEHVAEYENWGTEGEPEWVDVGCGEPVRFDFEWTGRDHSLGYEHQLEAAIIEAEQTTMGYDGVVSSLVFFSGELHADVRNGYADDDDVPF